MNDVIEVSGVDAGLSDDIEIDLTSNVDGWPDEAILAPLAARAFAAARCEADLRYFPGSELSLVFSDDAAVQILNRDYRNKDKPTNVLSFPGGDEEGPVFGPLLGDIVLARETVMREAKASGRGFDEQLVHLIIHGILHLFGYDHQIDEEAVIMEGLETRILASLGIADPYRIDP
ncbi:rRNA maturation RNase YbeY [Breoghania sp.]|uniref:rRNA maturation RNase YbeY n=1 Tax=Breoghania sp. TaxID=2065378 RepID=UPI00262614F6|nr:rRNA maturation RNase YbeY [Breoghania sp.]MDJ0930882.1 rRNA maturation RNase YbeY [Breoghania sp.]